MRGCIFIRAGYPPLLVVAVSRLALGDIRLGAAVAEEFPGRIHHRAAAGLPGRWRENQSNEVAFSGQRNRTGVTPKCNAHSTLRTFRRLETKETDWLL